MSLETPSERHQHPPFLLDLDDLRRIASEPIIRRGVAYFKEHRVVGLEWSDRRITAQVEGSIPGSPYLVEITQDHELELSFSCSCPFDWEPVCKHAVATLLAYGAAQPVPEGAIRNAADRAVEERTRRGRSEVVVTLIEGAASFGIWHAHSVKSGSAVPRPYRVQIRSPLERINYCSCPDFATNRLGTCKHIEAVLHRIRKRLRLKELRHALEEGPPHPFVHLDWDNCTGPVIRVRRGVKTEPMVEAVVDRFFDALGNLRDPSSEAFFRFVEASKGLPVQVGDDAIAHAQRKTAEIQRRREAEQITSSIRASGGSLPGIRAKLYPYQVEGVAFLASSGRAILADDMGLGKTLQTIAAATYMMQHAGLRTTLIVCPASLKHQWAREITRFTGQHAVVIAGGVSARGALYRQRAPFTVVNYELVIRDLVPLRETLAPDLLVLDEAQRIKNWRTKAAAAIKELRTPHVYVLTGTPLENRLEDLYSLMQVVDGNILGPLWRYTLDFHVLDENGHVMGFRNLMELRRRLEPVMLRRDRRLVRDQLPDKIHLRLDVPLSPSQSGIHDHALSMAARLGQIARKRPLTPSEEQRLMMLLQTARMACDAAGLVDHETVGSPKLEELRRLLEELCVEGGRKVVVFSQWERMTAMAATVVRDLSLGCVSLHGGVPSSSRGALIDQFRDDPGIQVFLSTDAGGVGLNLQCASAVINLDMPWNPAVLEQRIARVHRLGQAEPVQVIDLVAADSYEVHVLALMQGKRTLFSSLFDPDEARDVVGVSRRALEQILETLPEAANEPGPEQLVEMDPEATLAVLPAQRPERVVGQTSEELESSHEGETTHISAPLPSLSSLEEDATLAASLETLQQRLGDRIERILAARGGLVVVVDQLDTQAQAVAAEVSNGLPVVALDAHTAAALGRFGLQSPLEAASSVFERSSAAGMGSQHSPLYTLTQRKLRAAEVLLERGCLEEGMDALATAMMATAAGRAGLTETPPPLSFPVWLFSEALPKGVVSNEEALAIGRALTLRQTHDIPPSLSEVVLSDARRLNSLWSAV